ncbi:unnamed protein product [Pelagomonas calceolata]|uniref:Uncharacterized protein n=1 Tax=Pelagomonas calceolata TaxID=35677 RepID=A0A8J2X0Y8_9STRA|nr:unnamed protein product [Pelagomonas calceolata]
MLLLGLTAVHAELFTSPKVVAQFGRQNPARYFGIVDYNSSLLVYARTGHYPHADPNPRTLLWTGCDHNLNCISRSNTQLAPWPSSLAHNAAIYVANDQWYVIGGLWGPGTRKRGLERRGPFSSIDELLASDEGPFDGKVSVVDGRLYARANLVRRNASNGMFGGRHVQVLKFEPALSNFELISVRDYRGVGAPPVSGDNVYFAVVLRNPVAKGYILLAPVVREEPTRKAFIGMAFSCDGVHFSEFLRVLESTPASYGRGTDHPCGRVPRPPLDFDACWLACLSRARARGDTRRGGFLDSCLEPCYPPPGDECRSLRLRYGIRAGTSWGAAADSAAVQARWAALSCDELVGDGAALWLDQ